MSYQEECEWFAMYGSQAQEHDDFEAGAEDMELRAMRLEAEEMAKREWEHEQFWSPEEASAEGYVAELAPESEAAEPEEHVSEPSDEIWF